MNFNRLYGYYLDKDNQPCIDEERAAVIRDIFSQYLMGASLRMIKDDLESRGIPNQSGEVKWSISTVKAILCNEKYCGDVLMQKTFIQDCLNKKVVKNTGQLPMYLVENNHPAIISRERFRAVQAEMARRSAAESPSSKMASTGRASYASKYALSERLVCGECGTLYRRCTSEITELKRQQEELASLLRTNSRANLRLHKAMNAVDRMDHHMTGWDENMIRQIVHTVKVISAERIKVILTDGTEIDQEVRQQ